MAKPPFPTTQNTPNTPLAEQTLEQLQTEQTWWEYKSANAREETTRTWASTRLADVLAEIESR